MIKNNFQLNDPFNEYLIKALSLHLVLLVLIVFYHILVDMDLISGFKRKKIVKVVQTAVRVDVVGMPKMTLQELKKLDLNPSAVEIDDSKKMAKSNEMSEVEFKKVKKKVNLNNLLKNFSTKKVVKNKKKEKSIQQKKLQQLILEGNKVSKGQSVSGEDQSAIDEVFLDYIRTLPDRIRPFWKLPSYLIERGLQCRLRVFIASDGKVLKIELFESSGEAEYDQLAIDAVKKTQKFPKPNSSILARVTAGEVLLGFPL